MRLGWNDKNFSLLFLLMGPMLCTTVCAKLRLRAVTSILVVPVLVPVPYRLVLAQSTRTGSGAALARCHNSSVETLLW